MDEKLRELKESIRENAERTEAALKSYCCGPDEDLQELFDSEEYSLLGGGKRIRPYLVNEICRVLGGSEEDSMPFACALEMIHTYSLIHDDLPCMDDDDLRRGKPTNHKVFGYATALLAGDALLTKAFYTAVSNCRVGDRQRAEAVRLLSAAAGECGMIGGQIIDLRGETERLEFDTLLRLHALKTGALIECAARLGALAAGYMPDSRESDRMAEYAKKVGLCFQVIDDVLDEESTEEEMGKSVRTDASHNKTTFMTYFDAAGAREYAAGLTAEAMTAVSDIDRSERLTDLAVYLLHRTY